MPIWADHRITWRQVLPPVAVVLALLGVLYAVRSCRGDRANVNRREQQKFYLEQLGNPDAAMVAQAMRRLGEYGDATVGERLRPKLDDADPRVAGAACEALGRLGDAGAKDKILAGLRSRQPALAAGAAAGAGALKLAEALDPLTTLLRSSVYTVRVAAVEALGTLGDERAIAALERLEKNPASGLSAALTDDQRADLAEAVAAALATLRGAK